MIEKQTVIWRIQGELKQAIKIAPDSNIFVVPKTVHCEHSNSRIVAAAASSSSSSNVPTIQKKATLLARIRPCSESTAQKGHAASASSYNRCCSGAGGCTKCCCCCCCGGCCEGNKRQRQQQLQQQQHRQQEQQQLQRRSSDPPGHCRQRQQQQRSASSSSVGGGGGRICCGGRQQRKSRSGNGTGTGTMETTHLVTEFITHTGANTQDAVSCLKSWEWDLKKALIDYNGMDGCWFSFYCFVYCSFTCVSFLFGRVVNI